MEILRADAIVFSKSAGVGKTSISGAYFPNNNIVLFICHADVTTSTFLSPRIAAARISYSVFRGTSSNIMASSDTPKSSNNTFVLATTPPPVTTILSAFATL